MWLDNFLQPLFSHPALLVGLCGLLGLVVGSFLNVVIYRLPKILEREWRAQCAELNGVTLPDEPFLSLSRPASSCPHCARRIRAWENIPVVSFLWLRGRCVGCQQPIHWRYPTIELLTAGLSLAVALHFTQPQQLLFVLPFVWALIALTFIDLDTQLLPDSITLPLLWTGLLINLNHGFVPLSSAVSGAAAGYLLLWSVYQGFRLLTGKEGMGYGDFKLLAAIGAWLGWQMLPAVLLLSSLTGAVVGITLMLFGGHQRNTPIPFGPYLAGGALIALFWGNTINTQWLHLTT